MIIRTYPFGWLTPALAPILRETPSRLDDYLSLTRSDWHFLGLIASALGDKLTCPRHFAAIEREWLTRKRKDVLADVAPQAPAALVKLVPKLQGSLWRPATYRRLLSLAADPSAYAVLKRRERIDRRAVFVVSRLPSNLRTGGVLDRVRRPSDAQELVFALDVVKHIRSDLSEREIIRSLNQLKGRKNAIRRWVNGHYQHAPLPPAPWEGTASLTPVTSYAGLKRLALEFDNCVRTYHIDVLDGRSYFYRYAEGGKPVATVELQSLPHVGWSVGDIEGLKNASVSSRVIGIIRAAFAEAGIGVLPPNIDRWALFNRWD